MCEFDTPIPTVLRKVSLAIAVATPSLVARGKTGWTASVGRTGVGKLSGFGIKGLLSQFHS